MSEVLRTHTERCRDQRRIEALEAELAQAQAITALAVAEADRLAAAYTDALSALAAASAWRANALMAALVGGFGAVVWLRWGLGL